MEKIKDVSLEELSDSKFLKPLRMTYTQDERRKKWDLLR